MSILTDLADYLTSQGGFVQQVDLTVEEMPPDADPVLTLYMGAGRGTVKGMSSAAGQAAAELPQVKCIARSASGALAEAYARKAFNLLDGFPSRLINGRRYQWGSAVQSPFQSGVDGNGKKHYTFNVDMVADGLSTTSTS